MTSAETPKQTQQTSQMKGQQPGGYPWLKSYPPDVNWSVQFTPRPLFDIFDESVERFRNHVCTNFLGKKLTYGEIGDLANRAAKGLQEMGVGPGTKVGLLLPNTPKFIVFFFAILKAGGTVVNYNPLYSVEELEHQVKDSETQLMITLDLNLLFDKVEALLKIGTLDKAVICPFPALLPTAKATLFKIFKGGELANPEKSSQVAKLLRYEDLIGNDGLNTSPEIDLANDVAVFQYTGGTTGTPKGAMLTHANLSINQQQIDTWRQDLVDGEERFMGILPFFHVFAMTTIMNYGIAKGAEIILMPKFELDEGLKLISATKPTVMPGVPTLYNAMMNHPKLSSYDLSSLKFCISGGAPLPIEVKRGFESLTGCSLVEGYGLTETSPVATCNPIDGPVKEGSIGIPFPGTVISIRSLEDPAQEVPLGEKGEICISGPQVMKGYWNKPEETKDVFVGEFFRSGDVGYMDEDGFIYIVDRIKDLIISSGFNVYPRRIEEAIYEFPLVEEATVVGIPHEHRGEAPKAFVKLRKGQSCTKDELMEFLTPKLSKLELPVDLEFRDELPKTMIGKLSKKELREKP